MSILISEGESTSRMMATTSWGERSLLARPNAKAKCPAAKACSFSAIGFISVKNIRLKRARHRPGLTRRRRNPPESLRRQGGTPSRKDDLDGGRWRVRWKKREAPSEQWSPSLSGGRKKTGNENKKSAEQEKTPPKRGFSYSLLSLLSGVGRKEPSRSISNPSFPRFSRSSLRRK